MKLDASLAEPYILGHGTENYGGQLVSNDFDSQLSSRYPFGTGWIWLATNGN